MDMQNKTIEIGAGKEIKSFRSQCRAWVIRRGDIPSKPGKEDKAFKIHDCDQVTVWQEEGSLKRFYQKK